MRPQAWQIVILVIALVVLFGWKHLPNMARSLGQSMRIFKSEVDQMKGSGDKESRSAASSDTVRGEAGHSGGTPQQGGGAAGDTAQHGPTEHGTADSGTADHGTAGEDARRDEPRS